MKVLKDGGNGTQRIGPQVGIETSSNTAAPAVLPCYGRETGTARDGNQKKRQEVEIRVVTVFH